MKVKLIIPVNIEGRQFDAMTIVDIPVKDARALIRGGFAQEVKEKAIPVKEVETRGVD